MPATANNKVQIKPKTTTKTFGKLSIFKTEVKTIPPKTILPTSISTVLQFLFWFRWQYFIKLIFFKTNKLNL